MEKEFVPYELAVKLKELRFDEPCFGYFDNEGELILNSHTNNYMQRFRYSAPTFSQAFRWFREKYGLYSWITIKLGNKSTFCWVLSGEHTSTQYAAYFHTYEEAELTCLLRLIEIAEGIESIK